MKKTIEFTNFYNLLTNLVSELYPDETIHEVANRLDAEVKTNKDDLMSLMAHLYADTIATIQEMERFRSDLYIAVLLRLIGSLKDNDEQVCRGVEQFARSIVGLDTMIIVIEDGIAIKLGFGYECSENDSYRIDLLLDACEVVRNRKNIFKKYDESNINALVRQLNLAKSKIDIDKSYDPVKEALNILRNTNKE